MPFFSTTTPEIMEYTCDICDKSFSKKPLLMRHKKVIHDGIKDHKCSTCGKKFALPYYLRHHIRFHHLQLKDFKCEICSIKYSHKHLLKKHYFESHSTMLDENMILEKLRKCSRLSNQVNSSEKKFQCDKCKKKFRYEEIYENHRQACFSVGKKHIASSKLGPENEIFLSCKCCNKRFFNASKFQNHIKYMKNNIKFRKHTRGASSNSILCEFCDKKFKNKNSLRAHRHQYHIKSHSSSILLAKEEMENTFGRKIREDLKKLSCEFCKMTFTHEKSYQEHKENCRGLKCNTCLVDRTFNSWAALYAHSWKCSENPATKVQQHDDFIKCKFCDKKFSNRKKFQKHERGNSCKALKCDICDMKFETRIALNKHYPEQCFSTSTQNNHEQILNIVNKENHNYCDSCDKSFSQSNDLKEHINIVHNGQEYVKCDLCEESFSFADIFAGKLKRHINVVHNDQKDHKCDFCGKTFDFKITLDNHMWMDHSGFAKEAIKLNNSPKISKNQKVVTKKVEPYKCEFCDEISEFPTVLHLCTKNALEEHNEKNQCICIECDKMFESQVTLDNHMWTDHSGFVKEALAFGNKIAPPDLTTRSSPADFLSNRKLISNDQHNIHMETTDQSMKIVKKSCENILSTTKIQKNIFCDFCEFTFNELDELNDHISIVHSKKEEVDDTINDKSKIIAFETQGVPDGNDELTEHIAIVHSEKEENDDVDNNSKKPFEVQGDQDRINDVISEDEHSSAIIVDDNDNKSKINFEIQGFQDENDVFSEQQQQQINNFLCNCQEDEKIEASHFCAECAQSLCLMCVEAHARLKITKNHVLKKINVCNCQDEEKIFATHYCGECKEALCKDCVVAHQRLKITRKHILSFLL